MRVRVPSTLIAHGCIGSISTFAALLLPIRFALESTAIGASIIFPSPSFGSFAGDSGHARRPRERTQAQAALPSPYGRLRLAVPVPGGFAVPSLESCGFGLYPGQRWTPGALAPSSASWQPDCGGRLGRDGSALRVLAVPIPRTHLQAWTEVLPDEGLAVRQGIFPAAQGYEPSIRHR
jgi:hypothetical protein